MQRQIIQEPTPDGLLRPKGKVWRKMRLGDMTGQPFAEWAYVTPDAPTGIPPAKLGFEKRDRQHHVMESWFRANYRAVDSASLRAQQAVVQVSPRTEPIEVLTTEFKGIVPDDVIAELAEQLYQESSFKWAPTLPPADATAYVAQILDRLDGLEAMLAKIASASRGIGDNNPPEPIFVSPLSAEDRDAAARAIDEVRGQLASAKPDPAIIERETWFFQRLEAKLKSVAEVAIGGIMISVAGNILTPLFHKLIENLQSLIPALWHWIQASLP